MLVEQLMTKRVQSCGPEDTLERAAQLMWDHDCGILPVCGDSQPGPLGVITDRDIAMCAMFHPRPLRALPVSEAMSRNLRFCRPTDSVVDAEKIMREAQIRRLPVVDSDGRLVGLIALADLAREAILERAASSAQEVTETEVADTLGAICAATPRHLAVA